MSKGYWVYYTFMKGEEMIATCPYCEQAFYFQPQFRGQPVTCSRCGKTVEAPDAGTKTQNASASSLPRAKKTAPAAPKTEKTVVAVSEAGPRSLDLRNGLMRLTFVLSILYAPALYVIRHKSIYALTSLNLSPSFLHSWARSFLIIWAVYVVVIFVLGGFVDLRANRKSRNQRIHWRTA